MTIGPGNKGEDVTAHEKEFHAFDEDVRRALWGPLRKPVEGGGRVSAQGLVAQVQSLTNREAGSGLRSKLAASDKVMLALLLAIAEAVRIIWFGG